MNHFQKKKITKEIESWRGFADSLNSQEYKVIFNKMLKLPISMIVLNCEKSYIDEINEACEDVSEAIALLNI